MANISSSYGTVTVATTGTEEDLAFIEQTVFETTNRWEYGTHLVYANEFQVKRDASGRLSHEICFDGEGRWTYENNVESLGRWLKADTKYLAPEAIAQLENLPFELTFRYTDEEPGCGVLYDKAERLSHVAGQPLENMQPETLSESYYDYDSKNLVEYAGYDNETAWDRVGETYYTERLRVIQAVTGPDGQIKFDRLPRRDMASRKFLLAAADELARNSEAFSPHDTEDTHRRICSLLAEQGIEATSVAAAIAKYSPTCHDQSQAMLFTSVAADMEKSR